MQVLLARSLSVSAVMFVALALTPLTSALAGVVVLSNLNNSGNSTDTVNHNT